MAHINRLDTRWVQRIEVTMPLLGTSWIALTSADSCHPATTADAEKLERIAAGAATEADRKVTFIRYGISADQPDFNAWEACGCKITFIVETDDRDNAGDPYEYSASCQQYARAMRWAAGASIGDIVRMAQFFPHVEDTSYEADQSKVARDDLERGWRPVRTSDGVITTTDLDRLHEIASLYGGQLGGEISDIEKKRFATGMKTLIGELLAARVFVVHDNRSSDAEGLPITAS